MECRREDDDDDELSFSNEPIDCCVSIADMVGSTRITANIRASHKIAKYYSIFINNMAAIGTIDMVIGLVVFRSTLAGLLSLQVVLLDVTDCV